MMGRSRACCLAVGFGLGFGASIAIAEKIPSPEALEQSGARPVTLTVIEPHLSEPGHPVAIAYMAFPASAVLSAALGPDWTTKAKTIEFRALDGYVSRIDAAPLTSKKAYLAFARADHSPFSIDNLTQNEKNIPLGPYYLVWDNREAPELLSEGARDWPYQVIDVSIFNASEAALRPPGFNPALEVGLSNVKANCLTCHKVNGFGGEKVEGNLALVARRLPAAEFVKWTLEPSAVKPDTTMPALSTNLGEVERRAIAQSIYEYLSQVPVAPEPATAR
jgi:mono/diheme cytochrome c family protein